MFVFHDVFAKLRIIIALLYDIFVTTFAIFFLFYDTIYNVKFNIEYDTFVTLMEIENSTIFLPLLISAMH